MHEELANQVTEAVENDPELAEAELFRRAVRRELQRREIDE